MVTVTVGIVFWMLAVEGFAGCALRAFVSRLVGGARVDGQRAVGKGYCSVVGPSFSTCTLPWQGAE